MHRSRGYGLGIMLLGLIFIRRGYMPATHSTVAIGAGVLFVIVGAVYAARARRPEAAAPGA